MKYKVGDKITCRVSQLTGKTEVLTVVKITRKWVIVTNTDYLEDGYWKFFINTPNEIPNVMRC